MSGPMLEMGLYLLAGAAVGGLIAWTIQARKCAGNLEQVESELRARLAQTHRQNETLSGQNEALKTSLAAEQNLVERHRHAAAKTRVEIESLREKEGRLAKDLFGLTTERDELNGKIINTQNSFNLAKRRVEELQNEFRKSGDFYKGQLENSLEQRRALERKMEDAKLEQESLSNLLNSAKAEHESVSNLLMSAEARLQSLDSLENKVISLEADNAQLKHDATQASTEVKALMREVSEMDTLKLKNKELLTRLDSMENARKQYENDAQRYRTQYDQSEQESETLRIKLDDIETNLARLREQHDNARNEIVEREADLPPFGLTEPEGEADDLTEIVGIGKVFEATLHKLGIYHYRQIAGFGTAELARVNAELKEFKGRIEHDDWIGQARELHFKKYGEAQEA